VRAHGWLARAPAIFCPDTASSVWTQGGRCPFHVLLRYYTILPTTVRFIWARYVYVHTCPVLDKQKQRYKQAPPYTVVSDASHAARAALPFVPPRCFSAVVLCLGSRVFWLFWLFRSPCMRHVWGMFYLLCFKPLAIRVARAGCVFFARRVCARVIVCARYSLRASVCCHRTTRR
jgi:hypothetical protein